MTGAPVRTWRIALDDGSVRVVDACGFREDGAFTVFLGLGQRPLLAVLTGRIVSISREPDDDGEQPAEPGPAPDAPTPTTVHITVNGSVLDEQKLWDVVERHMQRLGAKTSTWAPYPRH